MMAKTGYDNMVGVNQETIMEDLEYQSIRSVRGAISELKKMNIIVSTPDEDIRVTLSPISRSRVKLSSLPIEI